MRICTDFTVSCRYNVRICTDFTVGYRYNVRICTDFTVGYRYNVRICTDFTVGYRYNVRICTDFNFPQPITEKPYNRYIRHIEQKAGSNRERSLPDAARYLRKVELNGRPDDGQILDVVVSVDRAWQKLYGFNSLNGMVFLISIDTGCVLDYIVKTKFWHECKANRNASEEWKATHKTLCCVNHEGSSGP